jgi:hypothetical protein
LPLPGPPLWMRYFAAMRREPIGSEPNRCREVPAIDFMREIDIMNEIH